ncbi:MAG: glycoside hydrolase family 88 protein [Kiritimatiellae bacterium]|nr:glycoside hydrolase family 88 protein [Kiritimatiellia bacterium]
MKNKIGTMILAAAAVAATGVFAKDDAEAALKARLPEIFAKAADHYRALDAAATPLMKGKVAKMVEGKSDLYVPHGWKDNVGRLDMRSIFWWTSGNFPGSLWYLYKATGDEFFKSRALAWTSILAPNAKVTTSHDFAYVMNCSFGNAKRILGTDRYDALLAETAETLAKRYDPRLGLIRSWGPIGDKKHFLVIPDNLMLLELLEVVSKMPGGDKRFDEMARSHADMTMKHHFRADGGARHVVDYDQKTLRVQEIRRGQGASCETAWARGQAWAMYGYTMMYRETGDKRYLDFACKLSDYAIGHPNMPSDGVPYWDFGAPGEERDSSAAAVMASALLELAGFVGGEKGAKYRAFAVKQLTTLSSPEYFSEGGEIGHFLLKHGVEHKPAGLKIDTPLDYGDYYYLEALLRLSK